MSGAAPTADVLVVGAGPAGSATAWRLARRGVTVRLLDAHDFPRSKPCGDAVSPGAVPLLREMGVTADLDRVAARLEGWRIRAHDGTWFEGRYTPDSGADPGGARGARGTRRGPAWGYALPRRELDALLLQAAVAAGAEFLPRRRVFDLAGQGGAAGPASIRLRARGPEGACEEHRARVVVGADGLRSRVARLLGGVRRGRRRRLGVVGRFDGAAGPARVGELRFGAEGVMGWAPTGAGGCNVTVVVPADRAAELSADPEAFFRERARAYGVDARLEGARLRGPLEVTGPFESSPRRTSAPGVLLVGDAAGYFDPTTGQGVYRALAGAALAAEAAADMLAEPGAEAARRRRYERALRDLVRPGRRVQWVLDAAVARGAVLNPLARLLTRRPALADLLVDVTGDRLPAGALLSPAGLLSSGARRRAEPRRRRAESHRRKTGSLRRKVAARDRRVESRGRLAPDGPRRAGARPGRTSGGAPAGPSPAAKP